MMAAMIDVGIDLLGLALEVQHDAVAQRRQRDRADVLAGDVDAVVQQRLDLAARTSACAPRGLAP